MKLITGIIIFIVFLSFGVGVWFAWYYTFKDIQGPSGMPQFVSYFVSSVNGLLVANLGAIIGVSVYLNSFDWMKSNPGKTQIIAAIYYWTRPYKKIIFELEPRGTGSLITVRTEGKIDDIVIYQIEKSLISK